MLSGVDVVLVLKDNTIVSALDALVRLCNRYGITLYASDLNSGEKGAALAFGVVEKEFGTQAGKKALTMLEQQQQPQEIPITALNEFKVTINTTTMHQQNLLLSPTQLFLLTSTKLLGHNKRILND
jgi:putative ABC transport system substrate-binding protein